MAGGSSQFLKLANRMTGSRPVNVLLVEDEERVADFIRRGLKSEGHVVTHCPDGEAAIQQVEDNRFDVVILDLMLPGISGQDVCRRMRARQDFTPVLMLTALDKKDERVEGLKIGADDYLAKPFDFEELLARIDVLHRRQSQYSGAPPATTSAGKSDGMDFDSQALRLTIDGLEIELSVNERELFVLFLSNPGKVLSRERILNSVWGTQQDPLTNIVDVYVSRLRRKLGAHGKRLVTVRGAGYRFEDA